jgi:hypothetical protein
VHASGAPETMLMRMENYALFHVGATSL